MLGQSLGMGSPGMESLSLRAEVINSNSDVSLCCANQYIPTHSMVNHMLVLRCAFISGGVGKKPPQLLFFFFLGYCWLMDILPWLISSLVPVELCLDLGSKLDL